MMSTFRTLIARLFFGSILLRTSIVCLGQAFASDAQSHLHPSINDISASLQLASVKVDTFTTLSHDAFPNYGLRIKRTEFCDPTVRVFTGYIDVEARHIFFYYFESRRNPAVDDVLFWVNGGPGGSSALGMLMELGPCNIDGPNSTVLNPFGWNSQANLLVVDQPIGVGWSYADYGETVSTTEQAAVDIAAFLAIFMSEVEGLKGRALHLSGESYAGRYLPLFGAELFDQNLRFAEKNSSISPVNLSSLAIGNGFTDPFNVLSSYYQMQCTWAAGIPPVQPISTCVRMREAIPRCERMVSASCIQSIDEMNCEAALMFCETELLTPFMIQSRNPYDLSSSCTPEEYDEALCYSETLDIKSFMNLPSTRELLGAESFPKKTWSSTSRTVATAFNLAGDEIYTSMHHLSQLLTRGIRVLLYVGEADLVCNWMANLDTANNLEWNGQEEFAKQKRSEWTVGGKRTGTMKGLKVDGNELVFVTIDGAGHMVPHDKPQESLAMINAWIDGEALRIL